MYKVLQNKKFDVQVFVEYAVTPVPRAVADEMYEHLLDVVWGEWRRADEDIRLTNRMCDVRGDCDVVRYQFGDLYEAEERMEEIAELIQNAFDSWPPFKKDF